MVDDIVAALKSEDSSPNKLYAVREEINAYPDNRKAVLKLLDNFKSEIAKGLSSENKADVRKGTVYWSLGSIEQATAIFESARTSKERDFFLGLCYLSTNKNSKAFETLSSAHEADKSDDLIYSYFIESQIKAGYLEDAEKNLERLLKKSTDDPQSYFLQGLLYDVKSLKKETQEWYNKALKINPDHQNTLFRLAYLCDLYGDDDTAKELYEQLKALNPKHVNTLLNLGIMYEDSNEYQRAIECYKAILDNYPNHWKAKVYLKDATASLKMYYDEEVFLQQEKERKLASQYIVELALPKRVKTALQSAVINTLNDLVKRTEEELEQMEGLGANAIRDIKEVLNSKGLSLATKGEPSLEDYLSTLDPKVLEKPLSELEWSARNKKLFEKLGTTTISDLVKYTEEDLIKHKNVGAASIKEIKQKLSDLSIELRKK